MSEIKDSSFSLVMCSLNNLFLFFRETTEAREVTRKAAPRNSIESEEYVKDIISLLNAKDFRDRINGINQLLSDTENNQDFVVANIVKVTVQKPFISKVFKVLSQFAAKNYGFLFQSEYLMNRKTSRKGSDMLKDEICSNHISELQR